MTDSAKPNLPPMTGYRSRCMLLTGGAGFIGSHLVRTLLAADADLRIVNLDKLTYAGSLENLEGLSDPARHTFVQGDICDPRCVAELLRQHRIDTIAHLAAESHVDRSIEGPAAFIQTNVVGTLGLLEAARSYWLEERGWGPATCRFHHVSTDEVFGSLDAADPPCTEDSAYRPSSPYAASKAAADHLVRAYHRTWGLPITLSYCTNNYGPRQHAEKLIPTVIGAALAEKPIPIYGAGTNVRDWLHVDDHCRGLELVLRLGRVGESYAFGGSNPWDNSSIARRICATLDELHPAGAPHARLIAFVPDRLGHDRRYAIDSRKARQELGWSPAIDFDPGLEATVAWYSRRISGAAAS